MNYIAIQALIEANKDSAIHENEKEQREDYFCAGGEFVRDKVFAEIIDVMNSKTHSTEHLSALKIVLEILKKY